MFDDLRLVWELWGYWRAIKGGSMSTEQWTQLATLLIPVVAPLITAGIKKLAPKIPKLVVVILQPILGALLGGLVGTGAEVGAVMGTAGIGVREGVDQTKKTVQRTIASIGTG